ncbi:hypothetical protein EI555_019330 [Monodon monoceros]|uniref:Alcohol dehydrogenase-like N-terminal domain-containing protein n=1 Tax=Monodon monoceros TaxID=40151 RepID=A0A4U1FRN3_MONMO|nr:hypothetical protein EI555_019330 [Monodon monoceros]
MLPAKDSQPPDGFQSPEKVSPRLLLPTAPSRCRKPLLPYTPGLDVAGIIESVGGSVSAFKKGDRVFTTGTISGGYTEHALAANYTVYTLPAHVIAGESVLVHGAGGGIGIAACQIARAYGLKNGAHDVFNHKGANYIDKIKKSVGEKGVDMITEMLANVNLSNGLNLLSHGG